MFAHWSSVLINPSPSHILLFLSISQSCQHSECSDFLFYFRCVCVYVMCADVCMHAHLYVWVHVCMLWTKGCNTCVQAWGWYLESLPFSLSLVLSFELRDQQCVWSNLSGFSRDPLSLFSKCCNYLHAYLAFKWVLVIQVKWVLVIRDLFLTLAWQVFYLLNILLVTALIS